MKRMTLPLTILLLPVLLVFGLAAFIVGVIGALLESKVGPFVVALLIIAVAAMMLSLE